jgi:hypothetical protein
VLSVFLFVGGISAYIVIDANRGRASVERLEQVLATKPTVEEFVTVTIELQLQYSIDEPKRRIFLGIERSSLPFEKSTIFEITFDDRRIITGYVKSDQILAP